MDTSAAPDTFDAFLSYHSGDAEWVIALKKALEAKHVRVWLDRDQIRPGDRFVAVLEDAMTKVGTVVVVVSPGALHSSWVQDEYHRALTLSNTGPRALRLIAVLVGDVEPPGFLANRDWVDFRDPSRFAERLDELVFGITGHRAGPAGGGAAADFIRTDSRSTEGEPGIDEVECLARVITRTRDEARRLRLNRLLASIPGLVISGAFGFVAQESQGPALVAVIVASPLVTVLVGWGTTATSLAQCDRKLEQFELLRDGLETCRARTLPGCSRLRENFWNMMLRQTGELGSAPPA